MNWLFKKLGYVPASQVTALYARVWELERELKQTEVRLWARYVERIKNDLQMSLSWMYSEHVRRVSMGIPSVSVAQENWPYYADAKMLGPNPPVIKPETL